MKGKIFIWISLIIVGFISCEQDNETEYNPSLGSWIIYPETIENYPNLELGGEVAFDTSSLMINENDVLEPIHQVHETYLNSNYIFTNSSKILELSIEDIPDGAYRIVYRACDIDFTQIDALTLSIHCESLNSQQVIEDTDVSVIVRLCSDTTIFNNYFEIELPVLISPSSSSQLSEQWPDENYINKKITDLDSLAKRRNEKLDNSNYSVNKTYIESDNRLKQKILGNPELSDIKFICVGIMNPGDFLATGDNDGLDKSAKIWIY